MEIFIFYGISEAKRNLLWKEDKNGNSKEKLKKYTKLAVIDISTSNCVTVV